MYVPERTLVVAPHPDDDVLGAGATMAKLAAAGGEVVVAIVSRAQPPRFSAEFGEAGVREAHDAHKLLGVSRTIVLDFPIAELDHIPHADVNAALLSIFEEVRPEAVFLPFGGDLFMDHQRVSLSSIVCARPVTPFAPTAVYCYETLSQTNWNAPYAAQFTPTAFTDVADHLETKLAAMSCFTSQLKAFPHERSLEAIRSLATLRGARFGCAAAEAFVGVRQRLF
ncbi:PIG-L deacetylase family protein [Nonomuraea sp. NPDC050786]|uniref:PIG-L deacetylase family protein n=1 Tax=Nonomuraea sp. NPDC050786 TaxID=3154840 RepID=UPI0033FD92D1